jgi:hypothetical protein
MVAASPMVAVASTDALPMTEASLAAGAASTRAVASSMHHRRWWRPQHTRGLPDDGGGGLHPHAASPTRPHRGGGLHPRGGLSDASSTAAVASTEAPLTAAASTDVCPRAAASTATPSWRDDGRQSSLRCFSSSRRRPTGKPPLLLLHCGTAACL